MADQANSVTVKAKRPSWFILLLTLSLLPILIWPLIFFGSIFLFDNPKNINNTYLSFLAINSYPVGLIILGVVAHKIYPKRKKLAVVLLTIPILLFVFFFNFICSSSAIVNGPTLKWKNKKVKQYDNSVWNKMREVQEKKNNNLRATLQNNCGCFSGVAKFAIFNKLNLGW